MTNEIAKKGISDILLSLDESSLKCLTTTVTQGLLKDEVNSKEEAIRIIIEYSPDELSVLKRKIITRDILFSYLYKNKVVLKTQNTLTKQILIDKILSHWKITSTELTEISPNNSAGDAECTENNISLLAEQFSEWFYKMLNSDESIGTEHFYLDAVLKIYMYSNGSCINNTIENNPEEIVKQLFLIKKNYNLFFNPNLTKEGVQGRIDPHGLVIVIVCGTLHSNDNCVGIFEQNFYLARDPFSENNWKIKRTEMNLKSQNNILGLPKLCDSEFNSNLVAK